MTFTQCTVRPDRAFRSQIDTRARPSHSTGRPLVIEVDQETEPADPNLPSSPDVVTIRGEFALAGDIRAIWTARHRAGPAYIPSVGSQSRLTSYIRAVWRHPNVVTAAYVGTVRHDPAWSV